MNTLNLFPTAVFIQDYYEPYCKFPELISDIRSMQQVDQGVTHLSNTKGWHSDGHVLLSSPYFKPVCILAGEVISEAAKEIGYSNLKLQMTNCWVSITPPGTKSDRHSHPGGLLSGVYYIQAGPGSSPLVLHDPRQAKVFSNPSDTPKTTPWLVDSVPVKVQAGRMIVFPSWLEHSIPYNDTNEDRIIFSFNFAQVPK